MPKQVGKVKTDADILGDQDRVMDGYKKMGAVKSKHDEEALHMFFSPNRVPKGMTKAEALEVIDCYALRQWQKERWAASTLFATLLCRPMPEEFRPSEPMTRSRFKVGMRKFKADVATILLCDIAGLHAPKIDMEELFRKFAKPVFASFKKRLAKKTAVKSKNK